MIGTALDLVTFIVIPLVFMILGANLANYDRVSRTVAFRAARERWTRVTVGKMFTLLLVSVGATVVVALLALLGSAVMAPMVSRLTGEINYDLALPETTSSLLTKLALTAFVSLFFGLGGYAIGFVTRSTSWPIVLAAIVLFLVPFLSWWDPRNALAALGEGVYDFWGQFEVRPPIPMDVSAAIAVLVAYLLVAGGVVVVSARSVRLR